MLVFWCVGVLVHGVLMCFRHFLHTFFAQKYYVEVSVRVGAYVLVSSPILLHVRELCDGLTIVRDGDPDRGVAPTERWLIAQDRGYVKYPERRAMEVRDIPGYREVLRVQMGRKKSVSLRERL